MNEENLKTTLYVYHGEYLSDSVITEIIRDLMEIKEAKEKLDNGVEK